MMTKDKGYRSVTQKKSPFNLWEKGDCKVMILSLIQDSVQPLLYGWYN